MKKLLAICMCLGVVGYASFCLAAAPYQKIYLKSGEIIEGLADADTAPVGAVKIQERRTRKIHNYPRTDIIRIEQYDKNGNLSEEFNYANGKKHGEYKIYDSDGHPFEEGYYEDDQQEGIRRHYYENGQVRLEKTYRDGKVIRRKEFDRAGSLISEERR